MEKKGQLIVVSGPSGAGKSSLIQRLLKEEGKVIFWVSCTTRARRGQEVDGADYSFIDEATFTDMIGKGQFLEWEQVHGYYYGTPSLHLRETLQQGLDVILDIDVKGALKVREVCRDALLIFVEPPSQEELKRRLTRRGEKEIERRMTIVGEEMAKRARFEYTIKNENLELAFAEFQEIIKRARERAWRE